MSKFGTNLIVAVAAFLIGAASASAFSQVKAESSVVLSSGIHSDAMGNICANQD